MDRATARTPPNAEAEGPPRPAPPPLTRFRSRYTHFVGAMKLVLPMVAGVIITLVIAWPQISEQSPKLRLVSAPIEIEETESGQKVVHARFSGVDKKNQPYIVTADEARQPNNKTDRVRLKNPKANITLESGAWVAASAPNGVYNTESSILKLNGGISLYHDNGYEFRTNSATIDLEKGTARGAEPVVGAGPSGSLAAKGFQIIEQGSHVLFTGKSKVVLHNENGRAKQ